MAQRLTRSTKDRMMAGVAGGIANYFDIDPTIVRLAFVLFTLFGGSGVLLYFILWLVLPSENSTETDSNKTVKNNAKEMEATAKKISEKVSSEDVGKNRSLWAVILIIGGFYFLLQNFGMLGWFRLEELWPLLLIVVGLFMLGKR